MNLRRKWLKENNLAREDGSIIYTKSTHFIMPMVGYELNDFISEQNGFNYLINCYLDIENQQIVIILDNCNDRSIKELLQLNSKNPYFIKFEIEDEDSVLVLFYKIPDKFKEDFDIFLTSKYSKMSETYKKKLVNLYGRQSNTASYLPSQYDVIYPTTFKRKQLAERYGVSVELIGEVSSEIKMEYEKYKNLEELLKTQINTQKQEEQYESKQ